MATSLDTITDYSKTQRIVLLIDLNPLLHLQEPEPYLTTLLASAKTLLSFSPLHSSLFSFKPFFSSLSPLLSSSKLRFSSLSLSFDHPRPTLHSLQSFLLNLSLRNNCPKTTSCSPRGSNVAASMRQLVHDYAWDLVIYCDSVKDGKIFDNFGTVNGCMRSNLVVLFSPIVECLEFLSEFLDVDVNDECLRDARLFRNKFRALFESVNDAFCSRDIHFSWVDVKCELESSDVNEFEAKYGFFECAIRDIGWGFCSSDSVVLGSALVHFGLIYPRIGFSSFLFNCNNDYCKAIQAQLSLEISDVSGKPLECKCCDLKLVNMEMFQGNKRNDDLIPLEFMNSQIGIHLRKNKFWGQFGDGIVKLHVEAVFRNEEGLKFKGQLLDPILVCESLGESVKDEKEKYSDFFAFRVLKILAKDMGEFVRRKGIPIWQILLSLLYRKGYWALVSFLDSNGNSHMGILKPFTVFSALLSIIEDEFYAHSIAHEFDGDNLAPFVKKMDDKIFKSNMSAAAGEVKRKKTKRDLHLLQDLTWNAFCKAAFESTMIDLGQVYFARECNNSKKLKFLKCWMKQTEKSSSFWLKIAERSKPHEDIPKEIENRLADLPQESEQPIPSSALVRDKSLTGVSRIQGDAALDVRSETSERFFSNLPNKIQQGLESEGMDLGTLAERLVNSSIYWLYKKCEIENTSESQIPGVKSDDTCGNRIAFELTELLLREPKDLIAMHKNNDPSIPASNASPAGFSSENIVKEYELQILFRMEILRSEVGASIEEPMKQKFVKQICLLLEAIQCHLEGGFFGDWSLGNYVQKIIRSRYADTLGDVVHKIYTKMDLLVFEEEDESSNHLLISEDSNQSWRLKQQRNEIGENKVNESFSVEDESNWPEENDNESPQGIKREKQVCKVMEAQERRERARRFASFTSWVPDLQRVWAPKQPKMMKPKSNWKPSKRKDLKRATYDKVCETPMTGNKRSCSQGYSTDDEVQDSESHLSGSVSKALFQDEW